VDREQCSGNNQWNEGLEECGGDPQRRNWGLHAGRTVDRDLAEPGQTGEGPTAEQPPRHLREALQCRAQHQGQDRQEERADQGRQEQAPHRHERPHTGQNQFTRAECQADAKKSTHILRQRKNKVAGGQRRTNARLSG